MLKTNEKKLVEMSVIGQVSSPKFPTNSPYRITSEGKPVVLPGVGGITYNVRVGDPACGWVGDHVEPCVSARNPDDLENGGFNVLSQAGNSAKVLDGEAKGATGVVTGKHGGIENVLIDFAQKDIEKMKINDKILVKGFGLGLKLLDFPDIAVMNIDPSLLKKLPISKTKNTGLKIPVTHKVPAKIMGSGLGAQNSQRGDYDIQLFDEETVKEFSLDTLRFGDIVAIIDADHTYGRIYKTGAVSICVIVHSDCVISGHGPGAMTIFTSSKGLIEPVINKNANIGHYLKIGRWRGKGRKK